VTRLLCVRHAESTWNAEGRWQGQADPPLSDRGRADAQAAATRLDGAVERVVSSDLLRAVQTAEIIAAALGIDGVTSEPDVREVDVGAWSGLTRDEIEAGWPGGIAGWRGGGFAPPGAEDRQAFLERVVRGLHTVAAATRRPTLVVTHGGAIGWLERTLGVHPGVPLSRLSGRWFEVGSEISAVGDRITLLEDPGAP
jgi:probable phosphoglycerate mutase